MSKRKRKNQRGGAKTQIAVALGLLVVGYVLGGAIEDRSQSKLYQAKLSTKIDYKLPVELQAIGSRVNLSNEQLIDVKAQIGLPGNTCGFSERVIGCYQRETDTIWVGAKAFSVGAEDSALLYEYGHHVWNKELSPQQRDELKPELAAMESRLSANPAAKEELATLQKAEGSEGPDVIQDELHSIACTKVQDKEMSAPLLAHCNQYLPGRASLQRAY